MSWTPNSFGRRLKSSRLSDADGNLFIVPTDHVLTKGPFTSDWSKSDQAFKSVAKSNADGIVAHRGTLLRVGPEAIGSIPFIVHLSGSSELSNEPAQKVLVGEVETAAHMGAVAVSVHLNLGVSSDAEQLQDVARVSLEAERIGMPLLLMAYAHPTEAAGTLETLNRMVGIAEQLHAAYIKVSLGQPSWDTSQLSQFQSPIPVLFAGGGYATTRELSELALWCSERPNMGIAAGRAVMESDDPAKAVSQISGILHRRGK